jgi:Tfp pilus assembly protein PilO
MAQLAFNTKRLQISKANLTMVIAISIATFVTIFSLVSCKALLSQRAYQAKVIAKKEVAKKQLDSNLKAVEGLTNSYKEFIAPANNLIGGTTTGQGDRDGDNAKIVLDALPSKYDYPALTASLEKLIKDSGNSIVTISGTDDELNQQNADPNSAPTPIEIPFNTTIAGNYSSAQNLISVFERSIRPINIQKFVINGSDKELTLTIDAKTYYQPETSLNITSEVVK